MKENLNISFYLANYINYLFIGKLKYISYEILYKKLENICYLFSCLDNKDVFLKR